MPLSTTLQSMPLQRRISVLVVAGLLAVFCLLGVVGTIVVRDVTQRTIAQRLVIARLVASFFDQELAENKTKLEVFAAGLAPTMAREAAATDPVLTTGADGTATSQDTLAEMLADSPGLLEPFSERIVLLDSNWNVRAAIPRDSGGAWLDTLRTSPAAQAALNSGHTVVSGLVAVPPLPAITNASGSRDGEASSAASVRRGTAAGSEAAGTTPASLEMVMAAGADDSAVVVVPVLASGSPVGLLLAVIRPSDPHLSNAMDVARRLGETGHAELVDAAGMVLISTEPGHAGGPGEHLQFYLAAGRGGQPTVRTAAVDGEFRDGAGHSEHPAGERHVMAYAPLREAPWGFTLGGTEAETLAPTWQWIRLLAILGTACLAAALFLVWLTTRAVVNPVSTLTRMAQQLAAGDLDTAVPVGGRDEVGRLAQSFEDMRRRVRTAHRELAIEKSRYEGIVQSMTDAVVVVDTSLRITSVNPAAERLLGWPAAEAVGRGCLELLNCRDEHDRPVCSYACPLAGGRAAASTDSTGEPIAAPADESAVERMTRRDGRPLVVATARSCISGEGDTPVGVVHVIRDVSAQEELRRLKDEFISTVSHELRTPLGFIKSYTTTLLRTDTRWRARTAHRFLVTIDQSADELAELIANLLDLSRIRAGTLPIHPTRIELHEVVSAVAARMAPRLSGQRLVLDVPPGLPPLQADSRRIEQVLLNLIDNAAKYAPGGTITVRAALAAADERVVLSVSDEGPGIPPEERELIFERFHRGRDAAATGASGSGLGLAICRGLIEAHGGQIWVDAGPHDGAAARPGATIAFTLPLTPLAADGEARAKPGGKAGGRPSEEPRGRQGVAENQPSEGRPSPAAVGTAGRGAE